MENDELRNEFNSLIEAINASQATDSEKRVMLDYINVLYDGMGLGW